MAMKIGGEYDSKTITPVDFEHMAEEAGLAKPIVKRRVSELSELVLSKLPGISMDAPAAIGVSKLIEANCKRLLGA